MKARNALTGLALVLGMALPAGAQTLDGIQLAQAPTDATRPAPGPGARPHWGQNWLPSGAREAHAEHGNMGGECHGHRGKGRKTGGHARRPQLRRGQDERPGLKPGTSGS